MLYFANDEGLLTFDGSRWKIYPLPNKTIVRSIKIAADHKIYAGGQGDFGYFAPDENGKLTFNSLKPKIPKSYSSFADIWNIQYAGKAVFLEPKTPFSDGIIMRLLFLAPIPNGCTSEWPTTKLLRTIKQKDS